jgi:hypothetical protein
VPVETRRFDSVDAFLDVAGPFLDAREPQHQLTLGLVGDRHRPGADPVFGALVAALVADRVVGTAVWTPPWNVIAARAPQTRLRECNRRGRQPAAARPGPALVLSVHGPGQPDLEPDLPSDRLRANSRRPDVPL